SVVQLQFPNQMNPHFFAYGSLPIYVIYFTGILINYLTNFLQPNHNNLLLNFSQAFQIGRFYSALFATLLIPLSFWLGKNLKNVTTGILAALLIITSVGFIQFAHFGTFEMWLTFFSTLLLGLCLRKTTIKNVLFIGIIFGMLVATKISALALLPIILLNLLSDIKIQKTTSLLLFTFLKRFLLCLITAFLIYLLTNPFVFSDYLDFFSSMNYESSVVFGTLPVFYTGEFFNTTPIIFQLLNIYPFLLNPLNTILFVISSIYIISKAIKTKNLSYYLLFVICYLLFFSQAFFFAKWTRYMIPTLPFIYLIIALALNDFLTTKRKLFKNLTIITIISINFIFVFAYFKTAFIDIDSRSAALQFAEKNIPTDAKILSENYDLGIITFNNNFPSIKLFNFYDLDQDPTAKNVLAQNLKAADYLILPSQRLLKVRLLQKNKFPQGHLFYTNLILGQSGWQKIYETPCDLFCKITYLGNPLFNFEETANVFDRPEVLIFKKIN
ncbi:MAG TPA: hypothetical protein VF810_04390, partial [Patescibacteria group bacterium]